MKRADRLYALMQRLKDGKVHTAEALAAALNVSPRTIYRDMEVLVASGVPVQGTRGEGYAARATITLPPLNLTEDELEVLHLGLVAVGAAGNPDMAAAAEALSAKVDAVLPEDSGAASGRFGFATYPFQEAAEGFRYMPAFRAAIRGKQMLRVLLAGGSAPHDVRPLHMDYWGRIWTCITWDETAGGFLSFRMDRIAELTPLSTIFTDEPGKRLADYRARPEQGDAPIPLHLSK